LPEIEKRRVVFVSEGEKAADAVASMGYASTTYHGEPENTDWWPLEGKTVVLLPDNDEKGQGKVSRVLRCLANVKNVKVKLLPLSELPNKGDAVEFIQHHDNSEGVAGEELWTKFQHTSFTDPTQSTDHLSMLRMSDVEAEKVEWLWDQRFAIGKLSIIAGDPGLGKSFVTAYMAATVSQGLPWCTDLKKKQEKGSVIILSAEDDPRDTIRPRLDAHNANAHKVHVIQGVVVNDKQGKRERSFSLATDMEKLDRALQRTPDCRLVVIDPIGAYMGKTDSHRDADVRGVLAPLSKLAEKYRVAVVAVMHLNKGSGETNPIYRVMGSLGFVGAARAVWCVMEDDQDSTRRLMVPAKNNLAADVGIGMAFRIEGGERVEWESTPVDLRAQDVMRRGDDHKARRAARDEAIVWLAEVLADGPVRSTDLQKLSREAGHVWKTVRRAMGESATGVEKIKVGFGTGARWYWRAEGDDRVPPEDK
jgi:hypothetical protein